MDTKQIARRIELIQKQSKLSQADLAALLGVTQPAIHHYLQGRIPPAGVLLRLAQLQGTSIEWILTGLERAAEMVSEPVQGYQSGETDSLCRKLNKLTPEQRQTLENFIDTLFSG
jgi:transcriptional regulator with XRE-family HTH domain